jgi:hypothetical protein
MYFLLLFVWKHKHSCISIMNPTWCAFIHFIENQRPVHVLNITCSSSGGATQTAFGILREYNVSTLWHGCSFTAHSQLIYARNILNAVCAAAPEDEQVMLETYKRPLILNKLNEKCISCFHYTDILWCTVSKTLNWTCTCFLNWLVIFIYLLYT